MSQHLPGEIPKSVCGAALEKPFSFKVKDCPHRFFCDIIRETATLYVLARFTKKGKIEWNHERTKERRKVKDVAQMGTEHHAKTETF